MFNREFSLYKSEFSEVAGSKKMPNYLPNPPWPQLKVLQEMCALWDSFGWIKKQNLNVYYCTKG